MRPIVLAMLLAGTLLLVAAAPTAQACTVCGGGCHLTYDYVTIYWTEGGATKVPVPRMECYY